MFCRPQVQLFLPQSSASIFAFEILMVSHDLHESPNVIVSRRNVEVRTTFAEVLKPLVVYTLSEIARGHLRYLRIKEVLHIKNALANLEE